MASHPVTEHHLAFLRSRGYKTEDIAAARKFVEKMASDERKQFFKEAEEWKPAPAAVVPMTAHTSVASSANAKVEERKRNDIFAHAYDSLFGRSRRYSAPAKAKPKKKG